MIEKEFTPGIGKVFCSLEKAIEFYEVYVLACGFVTRMSTVKRFPNNCIRTRCVVCNRQGFPNGSKGKLPTLVKGEKKVTVKRFGCKANIVFRYSVNGGYKVDQFYEGHNHQLTMVKNKEFHKLARNLSLYHKTTIVNNMKMNVGATKTFRLCKEQLNGYENIGASLVDFKNFKRDIKCFIGGKDGQMFIESLKKLVETRKRFYFSYEVDDEQNILRVFWADAEARRYYSVFGDALSYDPTYGTNKYCMVFTPFTGVDNHKKSVSFGAALIANEEEDSFKWVFEKFLDAMCGKEPKFIITDQDPAIKNVVPKVFKTFKHRFCMWHIMNKVSEKVGSVICKDTNFLNRINSIVWDAELEHDEFEAKWKEVITDFSLEGNVWLTQKFEIRDRWIPAFFRDLEMGHILRTTQRSESANSFFKTFENQYGTLVEFWLRFISAVEQQRHGQKHLEMESKSTLPKQQRHGHISLESHAVKVYTHEAFYEFQEEVKYSISSCSVAGYSITGEDELTTVHDAARDKTYKVQYNTETKDASCSCKLFERRGLLCRHIVWIFSGKRIKTIDDKFIAPRWTKEAVSRPIYDMDGNLLTCYDKADDKQIEMSKVWAEIFATVGLVSTKEVADMKNLCMLLKAYQHKLEPRRKNLTKDQEMEMILGCTTPTEVTIFPPKQSKNKGSGSGKRILSKKMKRFRMQRGK